jgi:hypothetical protein
VSRADSLTTFMCRLSRNSGASTSRNPKGLSRPLAGRLYLYLIVDRPRDAYSGLDVQQLFRFFSSSTADTSNIRTYNGIISNRHEISISILQFNILGHIMNQAIHFRRKSTNKFYHKVQSLELLFNSIYFI